METPPEKPGASSSLPQREFLAPRSTSTAPVPWPSMPVLPLEAAEEAHLWDYWRVLRRRRWTVIAVGLAGVIAAVMWTYTTRPLFSASAVLRIDREEPRVLKFEEVVKADPDPEYYQTQYSVLRSRTLANRVIALLGLEEELTADRPGWLHGLRAHAPGRLARWVPVSPPPADTALTLEFLNRLSVKAVRNTRLVSVSFQSESAPLAADVANTLAEVFIAYTLDAKLDAARGATRFLSGQMEEAGVKLRGSEESLRRFLATNDILVTPADKGDVGVDLLTKELLAITEALAQAQSQRIAKESLLAQARTQPAASLPAVLQSPVVIKLKQDLATFEGEYRKLGQLFGPDYPKMKRLAENIAELRDQLKNEAATIVQALRADYQAALQTEGDLGRRADEYRAAARRIANKMTQYSLLKRDADANREHYTALLTRLKETGVSSALATSNVSILDAAEVPQKPAKPMKALNLLIGVLGGLVGGIGLALVREHLDTSIKDARHAETILRVPITALVPSQVAIKNGFSQRHRPFALVCHSDVESSLAETFRTLGTNLILHPGVDQPPKVLTVTSLQANDGKTSVATNLAIALGQLRVGNILLVDAEIQHPHLHKLLGVPQAPGFTDVLTERLEPEDAVRSTSIPGLWVIPAGTPVPSAARVIASPQLAGSLEALARRFAHIIVDAPALSECSAASILASRTDGVVLVLRRGRADQEAARRAVRRLASARAQLLGVVLNDVDARETGVNGHRPRSRG
jgi:succinoglycan biosynthesis transport protein ExoP